MSEKQKLNSKSYQNAAKGGWPGLSTTLQVTVEVSVEVTVKVAQFKVSSLMCDYTAVSAIVSDA